MMIKALFLLIVLMGSLLTHAEVALQPETINQMKSLSSVVQKGIYVESKALPVPYDYLLTQPLMTIGIETYYRRTPMMQTVYALRNQHDNTYSRASLMFLDRNKSRNNVKLAIANNEAFTVELAFITMNFNQLPKQVIADVLNTHIPFGKSLSLNHVAIETSNRNYFSLDCNKELAALLACKPQSKVYGRTNTILRADNKQWLAHVVEVLAGAPN